MVSYTFYRRKIPVVEEDFYYANVNSFDDCEYICLTCDKDLNPISPGGGVLCTRSLVFSA